MPITFTLVRSLSITGGTKGCDEVPELPDGADEEGEEGMDDVLLLADEVSRLDDDEVLRLDEEVLELTELVQRDEFNLEDASADENAPEEPSTKEGRDG